MPGCVGLASELVEFDAKYQGVMDNLLGRTVVAEDLALGHSPSSAPGAIRSGWSRWRAT